MLAPLEPVPGDVRIKFGVSRVRSVYFENYLKQGKYCVTITYTVAKIGRNKRGTSFRTGTLIKVMEKYYPPSQINP